MAKKASPITVHPQRGLSSLQQKAAALLADGVSEEKVAAELAVPLDWVRSLEGNLLMAAAVVEQQWRKHRALRLRIRGLVERALDVVEEELAQRPSPELAVAVLRSLKVEPPEAMPRSAEVMLQSDCLNRAEIMLEEKEVRTGLGWGYRDEGELKRVALDLFERDAPKRLSAPEDPATGGS